VLVAVDACWWRYRLPTQRSKLSRTRLVPVACAGDRVPQISKERLRRTFRSPS